MNPGSTLADADGLALQRVHSRPVLKVVKVLVRQRLLRLHSAHAVCTATMVWASTAGVLHLLQD